MSDKKKIVRWQWILNDTVYHPLFDGVFNQNRVNTLTMMFYSEDEINAALQVKSAMSSPFFPSSRSKIVGKAEWTRTEFEE